MWCRVVLACFCLLLLDRSLLAAIQPTALRLFQRHSALSLHWPEAALAIHPACSPAACCRCLTTNRRSAAFPTRCCCLLACWLAGLLRRVAPKPAVQEGAHTPTKAHKQRCTHPRFTCEHVHVRPSIPLTTAYRHSPAPNPAIAGCIVHLHVLTPACFPPHPPCPSLQDVPRGSGPGSLLLWPPVQRQHARPRQQHGDRCGRSGAHSSAGGTAGQPRSRAGARKQLGRPGGSGGGGEQLWRRSERAGGRLVLLQWLRGMGLWILAGSNVTALRVPASKCNAATPKCGAASVLQACGDF